MTTPSEPVVPRTPFETEYRYDIQWMIDTYGINNLDMDNLLAFMSVPLAKANFLRDAGSVSSESTIKDWVTRVINLYNSNNATIGGENLSPLGLKAAKDLRV